MHNGLETDISAGARKAMDAFMYETQTAVNQIENAGIQNELVSANGASLISQFLRNVSSNWSGQLRGDVNSIQNAGSTNSITKRNAVYEEQLEHAQNAEQVINSGLSQKQGMTGQLAKEQQNMIQFAQIVDTINSYLGNLISGPLVN